MYFFKKINIYLHYFYKIRGDGKIEKEKKLGSRRKKRYCVE
jgi:hypothetical protein